MNGTSGVRAAASRSPAGISGIASSFELIIWGAVGVANYGPAVNSTRMRVARPRASSKVGRWL